MCTKAVGYGVLLALCFVPGCAVSPAFAQQPSVSNIPVLRANTRVVLVDAVVTDSAGKYIHDLTAKDFKVYEDGKEQAINSFSLETSAGGQPSERRYIALFFDNSRILIEDQNALREAASHFIDANAGPNRVMAIINCDTAMKVVQNFTSDPERLKKAVAGLKPSMVSSRARSRSYFTAETFTDPQVRQSYHYDPVAEFDWRSREQALRDFASQVAGIRGRKAIVLFTSNPLVSQSMVTAFNKANVALYYIGTTGAEPNQVVDKLTQATGGFAFIKSYAFAEGLQRVAEDLNEYYFLGFSPASSPDGSCHELQVKVERTGANVRARSEYCDVKPQDLLAGSPAERDLTRRLSGTEKGTLSSSIQTPYFFTSPNVAHVNLSMEMPTEALKVTKEKGKIRAAFNLLGIAYLPDGSIGARFSDTWSRDFDRKEQFEQFRSKPIHYEKQFEVGSGQYTLKVVFSSAGSSSFGRVEVPLTIDAYDAQHFQLSSLALSNERVQLVDPSAERDLSLIEGETSLLAHGAQIIPSASNRFKKSDQLIVYSEVYEPGMSSATPPIVVMKYRVVDRVTHEVKIDSGLVNVSTEAQKGSQTIPVGYVVPINKLAPGKYLLTAHAGDSAGSTSTLRSVEFEVE